MVVVAVVVVTVAVVVGIDRDDLVVVAVVEDVCGVGGRGELGLVNPGKLAKTREGVVDAS